MTVLIFLGALCGSLAIGVPVAFALIVCSVALMAHMGNFNPQIVAQNMVTGADNFQLLAIPFFLLAGELMNAGGLSRRIVNFAMSFVGHYHGGLGYVVIFAAVILAALSGSAAADTAALAAFLLPMMRQAGYDQGRAAGLIAAGGIVAPVIPPSVGFIIFGVAANVSITQLFLGGIVPGLMMGLSLVIAWAISVRFETNLKPMPKASWKERGKAAVDGALALVMPAIVLGGIRFGIVTPTEAAVVAAVYALVIGTLVYREIKLPDLYRIFLSASLMTALVMFLIAAAMVSAWLIAQANIPAQFGQLLQPFKDNQTVFLLVVMALVFVVGMALDFGPTVLILTPILMPLVREVGVNPVYFGVLFIIVNAIGLITPPVGIVLNVVCGVGKVTMSRVLRGVWPFLLAQCVVVVLLVLFPDLVLAPLQWLRGR
ncbi:TRAP transporter large permease subunit [Arsenicitalea aurantiaca]|uniref:TRAP transporter large permease protein n=1 Tax=Arsenicitalea aurantiaca TaxID=1783274 RepID=A0A433XF67_9HYPH|nr:TRAP transporter large permease subunit [Arsenicitalea aurantiaca]RUT32735.1 TRAP transporter large permease subunit [Arsenicitalea aurantiaca]